MFLNLLEFVLHLDHDVLHLSLIAFAARRIDLPTHLLSDETELFALSVTLVHRLAEVLKMVRQTLFLFVDIQLFDVVNHLLLEPVLVVFHIWYRGKALHDTPSDLFHSLLLVGIYAGKKGCDIVQLLLELMLQSLTFLTTERNKLIDSTLHYTSGDLPLLFGKLLLGFVPRKDIRHPNDGVPVVVRLWNAVLGRYLLHLAIIGGHQVAVDGTGICLVLLLYPEVELHLSAFQTLCHHSTNLHFLLAIDGGNACRKVERLAVERLYLCCNLLSLEFGSCLAVSSHR